MPYAHKIYFNLILLIAILPFLNSPINLGAIIFIVSSFLYALRSNEFQLKKYFLILTLILIFIPIISLLYNLATTDYELVVKDIIIIFGPMLTFMLFFSIMISKPFIMIDLWRLLFVIISIIGILQFVKVPIILEIIEIYQPKTDRWSHYSFYNWRATSIFPYNPNGFGVSIAIVAFVEFITKSNKIYLSIHMVAILASGSVTAIIFLSVSLIIFSDMRARIKFIAAVAALITILMITFPELIGTIIDRQKLNQSIIPSSLKARFYNVWQDTLELIFNKPFFGIGPGGKFLQFTPDSYLLDMLMRWGLPLGSMYFMLMFYLFYMVAKAITKNVRFSWTLTTSFMLVSIVSSIWKNDVQNIFILISCCIFVAKQRNINSVYS